MDQPYTVIELKPESLYTSLLQVSISVLSGSDSGTTLTFGRRFGVYDLKTRGEATVETRDGLTRLTFSSKNGRGGARALFQLSNAVSDAGYGFYPLVTTELRLNFRISACGHLKVMAKLPVDCGPYLAYSKIVVGGVTYDCTSESALAGKDLKYSARGVEHIGDSLSAEVNDLIEGETVIDVIVFFRRRTIHALGVMLVPLLVGFPLLIAWGYPGFDPVVRLSFSLSSVPVLFGLWYRYASGLRDPNSLYNLVWFLSAIIWVVYAVSFQTLALTPWVSMLYFAWIAFVIAPVISYRHRPFQIGKPLLIRIHDKLYRSFYKAADRLYYKEGFKEPAAR